MRQQPAIGHTSIVCRFLVVVRVQRGASDAHCGKMRPSFVVSYGVLLLSFGLLQYISRWLTWSKRKGQQSVSNRKSGRRKEENFICNSSLEFYRDREGVRQ